MTEYIEQTSASDRYEAARKALAEFNKAVWNNSNTNLNDLALEISDLAEATSALIAPPGAGESVERIADSVLANFPREDGYSYGDLEQLALAAARAGVQYAHERWEPADRPSQEQMLRWLGIEYDGNPANSGNVIAIYQQTIEEEIANEISGEKEQS